MSSPPAQWPRKIKRDCSRSLRAPPFDLLGRRLRRLHWRPRLRPRLATAVHNAHFLCTAFANKRTDLATTYADPIQELAPEAAPLANLNYHVVHLLERGYRQSLCR